MPSASRSLRAAILQAIRFRAVGRHAGSWDFILPCQPALADRPPAGRGWLHEIKFDGYRVIARKDGERVRLWARTTSDYSNAYTRLREAVAALPVDSALINGVSATVSEA